VDADAINLDATKVVGLMESMGDKLDSHKQQLQAAQKEDDQIKSSLKKQQDEEKQR